MRNRDHMQIIAEPTVGTRGLLAWVAHPNPARCSQLPENPTSNGSPPSSAFPCAAIIEKDLTHLDPIHDTSYIAGL